MRALAYAAILGAGLIMTGAAAADTWTDPAGRLTVTFPHGWRVQPQSSNGHTYIKAGDADHECQIVAQPNVATAASTPALVRRHSQDDSQYTQESWVTTANSISPVFPSNSAQFVSRSQDSASYWPVQLADLTSPHGVGTPPLPISTVHAGIQSRPGIDLMGFCYTVQDPDYPTPDNPALFAPILRSMGTPGDAALQAAAEAYDTAHPAGQAPVAQPAQQQAQQPAPQEPTELTQQRHDHRDGPSLSHP